LETLHEADKKYQASESELVPLRKRLEEVSATCNEYKEKADHMKEILCGANNHIRLQ
jgi:hypothetical protein